MSLEGSLTSFQTNYGHEAGEVTNEVIAILQREYRRAREGVRQSCPSFEEIQNIKEMEMMVRATIQEKIY